MVNDPRPWQMTVAKLRSVLESADPNAVVCLEVPAGGIGHSEVAMILNVTATDQGPVVSLKPDLEEHA